jgi:hypothetical protein
VNANCTRANVSAVKPSNMVFASIKSCVTPAKSEGRIFA